MPGSHSRRAAAFTLIELLVVVAIIGVLASIALPVLQNSQQTSRSARCLSNLRQLAAADNLYAADNNGLMANTMANASNNALYPQLLWPYVTNPNIKYPGYSGVPEPPIFVGTIFHCPQLPKDPITVTQQTPPVTFQNYRSYGMNYNMVDNNTLTATKLTAVPHPVTTMLFCDNFNFTQASPAQLAGRHFGRCNAVYCDGHAAGVTITASMRVASMTDPFWGDTANNPNQ